MMRLQTILAAAFVALLLAGPVFAGERLMLHVMDARALESLPGVTNGAVHMMIHNAGETDDRLIAAATPAAKRAELHTRIMDDGIMRMRPVEAIAVPAGGMAHLKPGGDHIMLFGVRQVLELGMDISLTLTFEHAGEVTLVVPVVARGTGSGSHKGHDGSAHEDHSADDGGTKVHDARKGEGVATHVMHGGGHAHHGAVQPAGVMGGHTMGAGQFMISYRYMPMAMEGSRDGCRGISNEENFVGIDLFF